MKDEKKWRYILTIIFSILGFIFLEYLIGIFFKLKLDSIENYIASWGLWAPLILLLIVIITSSIGFVFMIPVAITALLVNSYLAFLINVTGLTIGGIISFFASRYFARDYVMKKFKKYEGIFKKYNDHLIKNGFITIFTLRNISFIPFELTNIASGLSKISFTAFFLGTIIGVIPGTIITIYFIKSTGNIFSNHFLISILLLFVFSVIPLFSENLRRLIFEFKSEN